MYIVETYTIAVILTFVTMICWGSWANTQKLAGGYRFELFYWDYVLGILVFSLILGFTLGSKGHSGMGFMQNIARASAGNIGNAFLGGVIFNLSNILLVAAIAIAGMAIAFPVGVGLCMVLGVVINYIATPKGDAFTLFTGVGLVTLAIVLDALAYRKLASSQQKTPAKGILLSVMAGFLMAWFFRFVASSIATDLETPEAGKLTPYTAFFFFVIGIFLSNFLFNTFLMKKPIAGEPVTFGQYFKAGPKSHLSGLLGGIIWAIGTSLSLIAAGKAGYAISFGLGQGATLIGALWGVFIWKEFRAAPRGTNYLLALMFVLFVLGLGLIIMAGVSR
jgi:glucose uptake protein